MAIEFTGAAGQRIDFGTGANVYGLSQKTISFWLNPDSFTKATPPNFVYAIGLYPEDGVYDEGWSVSVGVEKNGDIVLGQTFSLGGYGKWAAGSILTTGQWQHIAITYDNSNVANDPIFYLNGVEQIITELSTPTGTATAGTTGVLRLGALYSVTLKPVDGKLEDPRIYNRILSHSEVSELYQARMVRSISNGLVFHPVFCGAAGLLKFDGQTLAQANTICDDIGGIQGIPYGSPIGRGNTIQRIY